MFNDVYNFCAVKDMNLSNYKVYADCKNMLCARQPRLRRLRHCFRNLSLFLMMFQHELFSENVTFR